MRFTLRELMVVVTAICICFGCYEAGKREGFRQGQQAGYLEASDHIQAMLAMYAGNEDLWQVLYDLWHDYPDITLIGPQYQTPAEWRAFVREQAYARGWKGDAVWVWIGHELDGSIDATDEVRKLRAARESKAAGTDE